MSILSIIIITMIAGVGTYAYFSDIETSTGNSFSAGTLDLKVMDNDESWGDGVVGTWTLSNMKPGDFKYGYVKVDNVGSIDGDHLEITADYEVIEESPVVESDTDPDTNLHPDWMAKNMTITSASYDDGTVIDLLTGEEWLDNIGGTYNDQNDDWMIEDADSDGKISLYDLKYGRPDNLPLLHDDQYTFRMTVKLDENAGNDFQGDIFDLTVFFILNQDSSQ